MDKERLLKVKGVGRFQVMALLQAARYYILYGGMEHAKSYGLNRAIFYAWAKQNKPQASRAFKSIAYYTAKGASRGKDCPEGMRRVLGDCIEVSRRGFYMIGGREQKPGDFDREVMWRLRGILDEKTVWEAAIDYVSRFPRSILEDSQKFYKYVYEPVRDVFFTLLVRGEKPEPPRQLVERLEALEEMARRSKQASLLGFIAKGNEHE
ncbi:MAG: hypothetical protein ABWW69_00235 [Pyrodictiaceae archaeon]